MVARAPVIGRRPRPFYVYVFSRRNAERPAWRWELRTRRLLHRIRFRTCLVAYQYYVKVVFEHTLDAVVLRNTVPRWEAFLVDAWP